MAEPEKLTDDERKRLADSATQTSFTWFVLFLAFVAGLVGLLQIAKPYQPKQGWWIFSILLFLVYSALTFGFSYSIYATFQTRYIIIYLNKGIQTNAVKSFLRDYWSRFYEQFIVVFRNDEVFFRKKLVLIISILAGILSILLLFSVFISEF